jgi:hypothetical protein
MDYTARSVPLLLASLLHKTEWRLPDGMGHMDVDLSDRYGTVLDLARYTTSCCASTAHSVIWLNWPRHD